MQIAELNKCYLCYRFVFTKEQFGHGVRHDFVRLYVFGQIHFFVSFMLILSLCDGIHAFSLLLSQERIEESKTLKGRYFNMLGYFFSVYCIWKIFMVGSVLKLRLLTNYSERLMFDIPVRIRDDSLHIFLILLCSRNDYLYI